MKRKRKSSGWKRIANRKNIIVWKGKVKGKTMYVSIEKDKVLNEWSIIASETNPLKMVPYRVYHVIRIGWAKNKKSAINKAKKWMEKHK